MFTLKHTDAPLQPLSVGMKIRTILGGTKGEVVAVVTSTIFGVVYRIRWKGEKSDDPGLYSRENLIPDDQLVD